MANRKRGSVRRPDRKAFGANVTGVCSTNKMDMVRGLGADQVIDYTRKDHTLGGQRYDWIVAVAGNRSIFEWRRASKPRGVYVMAGGSTSRCGCLFLGPVISLARAQEDGIVGVRLTAAAGAHGLALAVPEAVMARPTGVEHGDATIFVRVPIAPRPW